MTMMATSNIKGRRSFSISISALYLAGDSAQEEILTKLLAGDTIDVYLRPEVGTGEREWQGTVRITSMSEDLPNDDALATDIEMQGTGALVDGTQT